VDLKNEGFFGLSGLILKDFLIIFNIYNVEQLTKKNPVVIS